MEPWYRRAYLWGQVNLTEMDPQNCDLEIWKEYWKRSEVEGVIINCSGIVSYYPGSFPGQYRAAGLGTTDYFGMWNQAAREAGLFVIARMDINCTTRELFEEHPEWYCRDRNGQPVMSQGRYVTCVNGDYYRKFIPEVFREVIGRYHPDGFADNSWAGPGMKTICYCENCRKAFFTASGYELPSEADWEDPVYREWVRWSFDLRVNNWKLFNEVTELYGGRECKWFGMVNADPFATGGRFYDIKRLIGHAPFIFCDHQSREKNTGFSQNTLNGELLGLAAGEGVIVAESMAHYYKGMKTFRLTAASRCEVRKWMMAGLAGGIAPWFHFVGGGNEDRRKLEISDDIFRWIRANKDIFLNRKCLANVGVVWNQESAVYYGRENAEKRSAACFRGMTESLSRAGIPFMPVHADDIGRYADRLEVLILPNVAILSGQQEKLVTDWIQRGKHLIVTDETALYDEDGEWKGAGPLYRALGITVQENLRGEAGNTQDSWMVHDTHSYLEIRDREHPVFERTQNTELLPFGGSVRETASDGKLEVISTLIPPFPIYPPEFSWIREKSAVPAIYAGTLKSGSRVVYFPADIDRCYGMFYMPDHKRVLEAAVEWVAGNCFSARVKGPGHIGCSVSGEGDKTLIHLVNLAGCDVPLGTLEESLPIGPVEVILQDRKIKGKVRGLWSGDSFETRHEKDRVIITVPRLEEQEVILFENVE